mgnify:CR=1 FL=1
MDRSYALLKMFARVAQSAKHEPGKCDSSGRYTFQALVIHFELTDELFLIAHAKDLIPNEKFSMSSLGLKRVSIGYSFIDSSFCLLKYSIVHCLLKDTKYKFGFQPSLQSSVVSPTGPHPGSQPGLAYTHEKALHHCIAV